LEARGRRRTRNREEERKRKEEWEGRKPSTTWPLIAKSQIPYCPRLPDKKIQQ